MRPLSPREETELFVLSFALVGLAIGLFLYASIDQYVNPGYVFGCVLLCIGYGFHLANGSFSLFTIVMPFFGMLITQAAFFDPERIHQYFATNALQFLAILITCATTVTAISSFMTGISLFTKIKNSM